MARRLILIQADRPLVSVLALDRFDYEMLMYTGLLCPAQMHKNLLHILSLIGKYSNLSITTNLTCMHNVIGCGTLKCENAAICEKVAKCENNSTLTVKIDAICEKITLNVKK